MLFYKLASFSYFYSQKRKSCDRTIANKLYKKPMKRLARKYHRIIAPIVALPLILTVLTGMLATIIQEWPINTGLTSGLILSIHTGELFHLQAVYPILNGLGLMVLVVTGISLSGVFGKKKREGQQ